MVKIRYRGQRGNQLFQYCLARIVAEERGYALRAQPLEGFPVTAADVPGRVVRFPWRRLRGGHQLDLDGVLRDPRHRRLTLDGYFLNFGYYQPYQPQIRRWVGSGLDGPTALRPGPRDLLVMVRLGDFVKLGAALAWSYFEAILEACPHDRLYVTSDQLAHPFLRRFAPYHPTMVEAGPLETLRLASRFPRLAISNSTFGWWAAFLGVAEEVWFPMPDLVPDGAWAVNRLADGVDLRVDEPRYRYVYGVPTLAQEPDPEAGASLVPLEAAVPHARFHARSTAYRLTGNLGQGAARR